MNNESSAITSGAPWREDWESRLAQHLRELGCSSVTEYLDQYPALPYVKAASQLGDDVAAVQLIWKHFQEADTTEKLRRVAQDSLAREIRDKIKRGWGIGKHFAFRKAHAFASWSTHLENARANSEQLAQRIWEVLLALNPPENWLPNGFDDPLIVRAFDEAWPVSTSN